MMRASTAAVMVGSTRIERRLHRPLAGALLAGGVDDCIDKGFGRLVVAEVGDLRGDLDQERRRSPAFSRRTSAISADPSPRP
jgi:hypothetical protein